MKRIFRTLAGLQGIICLGIAAPTYAQPNNYSSSNAEQSMKDEAKNKEVVRHLYEDILNTGRLELLNEVFGNDYIGNAGEKGPEGAAASVGPVIKAFPDIRWTIEELIAEGDKVMVKWTWKGTHTGPFQNYPISHNQVQNNAMALYQLANCKIVKAWLQTDRLGFLQQIGMVSKELGTPSRK